MITHLKADILDCKVKWALESITMNKASGGDRIPAELIQILNDDAVKVLHSKCRQILKIQQYTQVWKRSVFIPIPKKAMPKNVQTTAQLHSSHMLAKQCSKFSKLDFNSRTEISAQVKQRTSRYSTWILKRQRNQRSNCQHPLDHRKSNRFPEKHLLH